MCASIFMWKYVYTIIYMINYCYILNRMHNIIILYFVCHMKRYIHIHICAHKYIFAPFASLCSLHGQMWCMHGFLTLPDSLLLDGKETRRHKTIWGLQECPGEDVAQFYCYSYDSTWTAFTTVRLFMKSTRQFSRKKNYGCSSGCTT